MLHFILVILSSFSTDKQITAHFSYNTANKNFPRTPKLCYQIISF